MASRARTTLPISWAWPPFTRTCIGHKTFFSQDCNLHNAIIIVFSNSFAYETAPNWMFFFVFLMPFSRKLQHGNMFFLIMLESSCQINQRSKGRNWW